MYLYEKLLMFCFTGLSNLWCFPALYVVYRRNMLFGFMIGVFTFICSFMYHSMESLEIESFYITTSDWHKLDNIGSIMSMIYLFIFLMDNLEYSLGVYISKYENNYDRALSYTGLFITLLMQTNHPWHLENTLVPVLLFFCISLGKIVFVRRPRINKNYLTYACGILGFGFFCFYKGLDDDGDYLRFWHGIWHFCGSTSLFYFYQSIPKNQDFSDIEVQFEGKNEYYGYWSTLIYLFSFGLIDQMRRFKD